MTRALPFTEASLRRRINAARKAGLRVTGIRDDGTVLVSDGDKPQGAVAGHQDAPQAAVADSSRWGDVEV